MAKYNDKANHARQMFYLKHGIVMLPTLKEEIQIKKRIAQMRMHGKYEATQ